MSSDKPKTNKQKTEPKYKQSETVIIKRSQIKFAPYNPKNHTEALVKEIRTNVKNVAFFGGVIWNVLTGNLVDGHKRIMALDTIHKYDGTPETDYDVKVEKCELDDKTEMEQNIFQTKSRTDLDYTKIAEFVNIIEPSNAGLDANDLNLIAFETNMFNPENEQVFEDVAKVNETKQSQREQEKQLEIEQASYEDKKQQIKDKKAVQDKKGEGSPFFTVTFPNFEAKAQFLSAIGVDIYADFVAGERIEDCLNF